MFDVFEKHLRNHVPITDDELELIRVESVKRSIRKWQPILLEGEIWGINCFIASGCFRLYRLGEDGRDHTLRFGIDNWWISDQESYNNNKPSEYNIEALAASTVFIWPKAKWSELMETIPALKKFNEMLLAKSYEASQRRIFSLISYSAEEKYKEFQRTYPSVFNRVPLHMVASYLGISRETLSRIRKEFTKHP
ncbi:cyclic nucleotide-binding protein [Niastella yeongjuensis]|uniref:Cyclic nucleotide-binding protein n=1 Tax=Niastella yeongjuensis TaxID=354355 RepID=A0A1V9E1Z5_9BACT|nr:Crp/Fnr family transcriptional regulator [Niastella yeongjuensis]OQP40091.1 cyclic nucleotide-binding protein [Niastella yeongjuensis]